MVGHEQDEKRAVLKLEALRSWVSSVGNSSERINVWAGYPFPGWESKCDSELNLMGFYLNTRGFVVFGFWGFLSVGLDHQGFGSGVCIRVCTWR